MIIGGNLDVFTNDGKVYLVSAVWTSANAIKVDADLIGNRMGDGWIEVTCDPKLTNHRIEVVTKCGRTISTCCDVQELEWNEIAKFRFV